MAQPKTKEKVMSNQTNQTNQINQIGSRVRGEDVKKAMFASKTHTNKTNNINGQAKDTGTTLYTFLSYKDEVNENGYPIVTAAPKPGREYDPRVCAKKLNLRRGTKFYIRIDSGGYFYDQMSLDSHLSRRTQEEPQFVDVNEQTFENYIEYLLSGNKQYLKMANKLVM